MREIRETLPLGEAQPELRAARHLQWITEHTGLMRFEGQGETEQIRFWHRLFREYLAARELAQGDRKVRELVQDLWEKGRLREPFWQDVIRLLPRVLGTTEKAQALAQELEALALAQPGARGRLLGLVAAGMIESRELYNKEVARLAAARGESLGVNRWSAGLQTQAVMEVSFYEALAYCSWCTMARADARVVRLMTEAEWEHVCRSVGGAYPWGDDPPGETDDWRETDWGSVGHSRFLQIGFFPSVAGVADMVNSPQWCDSTHDAPYGLRATQKAKAHGGVVAPSWNLVTRGASQRGPGVGVDSLRPLRCAYRPSAAPSNQAAIRLVLDPPP